MINWSSSTIRTRLNTGNSRQLAMAVAAKVSADDRALVVHVN